MAPVVAGSIPVIHPNFIFGRYNLPVRPPTIPSAPDQPLYEQFFGLREQPFALTSDPRFIYLSESHKRAYQELLTGLRRREGLLLLTADTGMGKTTLCRAVIDALGARTFSALILNPYMTDAEVVRVILRDFGLVTRDDIRKGAFANADMPQLLDTLEQFLLSLIPLNSYAVVVIDEAQSLPARVIDQIRQLGAYEQDGQRLLQIILAGQPSLNDTLRSDAMRAVDGRVSRRAVLGALSPAEVEGYIQHRLSVAGGRETVTFPAESARAVAELTEGVPRRINLLCDRALEEGRVAGTSVISPAVVRRAARLLAGGAESEPVEVPVVFDHTPVVADEGINAALDHGLAIEETPDLLPEPEPRRWFVRIGGAVLALALAYFGWTTVEAMSASTPALPATPPRDTLRVPDPRPLPTEDDVRYVMQEIARADRAR